MMILQALEFRQQQDSQGCDGWPHPQHVRLQGDVPREYYALVPAGSEDSPPLVLVHGISRNAAELVTRFAAAAERFKVPLIAPLYRKNHYGMYQQLVDRRSRRRADDALFDILRDASARWGLQDHRFHLFGFSGGAQFAHRFALLHPGRLLSCIPVSAGWYCWPDQSLNWPGGLARAPGPTVDARERARVPIHLVVGSRDIHSGESLRRNESLDALQGTNRLQRARRWCAAVRATGLSPGCSLTILPGARHSFNSAYQRGLVPLVFELLGFEKGDCGGLG